MGRGVAVIKCNGLMTVVIAMMMMMMIMILMVTFMMVDDDCNGSKDERDAG